MHKGLIGTVKSFLGVDTMPTVDLYGANAWDNTSAKSYATKDEQLNANLGWVHIASQTIADDCSAIDIKLYEVQPDGDLEEVADHEILNLLREPNLALTGRKFWSLYYQYLNLTGEVYILKLDKKGQPLTQRNILPSALQLLPSNLCQLEIDNNNYANSIVRFNNRTYPITSILRDLNPDPRNYYRGLSVIQKFALTIDTDNRMKEWNNALFRNGARPSVIISVPTKLSDEQYARMSRQFDAVHQGASNTFKKVIMEGGASLSPYMLSQQDLDFIESRRFTRDEILAMFKMSKANLGIVEDVNRANNEAQQLGYAKRCLIPRLEGFIDIINRKLLYGIYGGRYVVKYESPIPEDNQRKLNLAQNGVNRWLTINEVREMYGYSALDNGRGDVLYVPINSVPIDEIDNFNDFNDNDDTELSLKTQDSVGEAKVKDYIKKSLKYEKKIIKVSRHIFSKQLKETLKYIDANKDRLTKKTKASDDIKPFDKDEYDKLFASELKPIMESIVREIGTAEFERLNSQGQFNPYSETITKYIDNQVTEIAKAVDNTTYSKIAKAIDNAIQNKFTIEQLEDAVGEVFANAWGERAYVIAQTEATNMLSFSDTEAWKQSDLVEYKEWYTAQDERVCPFCNDLNGRKVKLNDNFYAKGETLTDDTSGGSLDLDYREIAHCGLHAKCRCTLLPVLKEN